jgi:hypothetical protein
MKYLLKPGTSPESGTWIYDGHRFYEVHEVQGTITISPASSDQLLSANDITSLCDKIDAVVVDLSARSPKQEARTRWKDLYG